MVIDWKLGAGWGEDRPCKMVRRGKVDRGSWREEWETEMSKVVRVTGQESGVSKG